MVADAWARWPLERLNRLRIFTLDPASVPTQLRPFWMPYDERLDSAGRGYAGTRADFAQRALRHFVDHFVGIEGDAEKHAQLVTERLAPLDLPVRPNRLRLSDQELIELIRREWSVAGGRSSTMLPHLRRNLNVACEQGRFKDLFKRAAAEQRGALL
jgi:hypothetical protein